MSKNGHLIVKKSVRNGGRTGTKICQSHDMNAGMLLRGPSEVTGEPPPGNVYTDRLNVSAIACQPKWITAKPKASAPSEARPRRLRWRQASTRSAKITGGYSA